MPEGMHECTASKATHTFRIHLHKNLLIRAARLNSHQNNKKMKKKQIYHNYPFPLPYFVSLPSNINKSCTFLMR